MILAKRYRGYSIVLHVGLKILFSNKTNKYQLKVTSLRQQ